MKGIYWRIQRGLWRRTISVSIKMIFAGRLLLMDYWPLDMMLLSANLAGKNPPLIPPVLSLSNLTKNISIILFLSSQEERKTICGFKLVIQIFTLSDSSVMA